MAPLYLGLERFEIVIARNQPEYQPLRSLVSRETGRVLSRWSLTPEQRAAVAAGADIFLDVATFGQKLQPVLLSVGDRPDAAYLIEGMGLPVEDVLVAEIAGE